MSDEVEAPKGSIWICGACGKQAKNRYTGGISRGWDESCMRHSTLCKDDESLIIVEGRAVKAIAHHVETIEYSLNLGVEETK